MARAAKKSKPQEFQDESVSAGRIYGGGGETLSAEVADRHNLRFTADEARRIKKDAEVHAAVEFILDAILADGIETVGAAFEDDPEFDLAEEIAAFVRRSMLETCSFFARTYKELMRGGFCHGHKVGEIVLRLEKQGIDSGKLVLDRIKVKPNNSIAFYCDEFMNPLGLIAANRGQISITSNSVKSENIIPLDKFLIVVFEQEDSDPRGVRQTEAAYEPFCDKSETRKQFKLWRRKCAVRSFIGTTPEGAKPIQVKDDNNLPVMVGGVPKTKSPMKATSETLAKMQNDTVAVFSHGTEVQALDADGTGEQFIKSFSFNNQEIRKAILLQSGATAESDKGGLGKAGKEVDERVLNRRINSFRRDREIELYKLGCLLVELNFGADKVHLSPAISLGDAEKTDFSAMLGAYSSAGYSLHESQFDEIDRKLGNPKRDMKAQSDDDLEQNPGSVETE